MLPVLQEEDAQLQDDLRAGRCLLTGRDRLVSFDKKEARAVIEGKAENASYIIDVEDGGWVRGLENVCVWLRGRQGCSRVACCACARP